MAYVLAFPTEIPNNGVNPHYLANPQIQWNWFELSNNPNITIEDVLANPQIRW
jgi:hypothetical protein